MAEGQALSPAQMVQMNLLARQAVLANGLQMTQQISSQAVSPASQPTINVPTRNVGLILGFLVEIVGTIANTGAGTLTRTGFGSLNAVSQFVFSDLNNNQRIQTSGRHIGLLNSARQGFGFGGAYSPNLPNGMGNNWTVQSAPATIATTASGDVSQIYYVPLAYSADDLRGAIYAAVVNATMNLQISLNQNPCVASGDPLNAIYSGTTGGWSGNVTVNVYQVYIDQLPMGQGGKPILPALDLNTIYDLKSSSVTGITAGQDFAYAYANFREFLSTIAIYDQDGTFNVGSDVNYWALQAANYTNIFKYSAKIAALLARQTFMADPPAGTYYFDHRRKPLLTNQYGNLELVLNASSAAAGSQLVVATEAFAQVNQIVGAGSLPTG